jgi:hypothetical protein
MMNAYNVNLLFLICECITTFNINVLTKRVKKRNNNSKSNEPFSVLFLFVLSSTFINEKLSKAFLGPLIILKSQLGKYVLHW